MRKLLFGIVATFCFTCLSGDFSVRAAGTPDDVIPNVKPDVLAEQSVVDSKTGAKADKTKTDKTNAAIPFVPPTDKYQFHQDVQSFDDAISVASLDADTALDPNTKVVVKMPESCREFSAYMDARQKKLDDMEQELKQKQEILESMKKQFETLTEKYAVAEGRVKTLVQRDPGDLKNNPELAKMIKLYETLAPEDAAARLRNLDLDLTLALLKGMKPKKLSSIMESLEPKLAAALSSQIVRGF